jgi:hypothetical protein
VSFLGISVCSGDHSLEVEEDLVNSGYKPEINYKYLIILLYVWLHNENHICESDNFYSFFSPTSYE